MRTLEYWRDLSALTIISPAYGFHDKVACVCVEIEEAGGNPAIWHAAHTVTGRLDLCPCVPCRSIGANKS